MAEQPLVGIIMGSKSDLPTMEACTAQLEELGVPYELVIASAHRNPDKVHEWAGSAAERGLKVIIAAAGKAAHLGGVVAAFTPLPIIGVPMKTSDLGGMDSLLSMVQMPSGVPVACVAITAPRTPPSTPRRSSVPPCPSTARRSSRSSARWPRRRTPGSCAMAAHFRQPDEGPRGAHAALDGAHAASGAAFGQSPRRPRHQAWRGRVLPCPRGQPPRRQLSRTARRASSRLSPSPRTRAAGHDRRRKGPHFVETDPYDLAGRRSRSIWKRLGRVLSVLLFLVGIGLIVAAAALWINNQRQYAEQERVNEELAAFVDVSPSGNEPPQVDWASLKAVNDEVVGWVQIPGTVVNFPVYQASDNEKYLHTSAEGAYTIGGQIFMDYENTAPGMVDAQTIIYGHHLRDGSMFKVVSDMQGQEMFDSVSVVWYVTEAATYQLRPLLAYPTTADDTNVRQFNFASVEDFHAYLTGLLDMSTASCADAAEVIAGTSQVLSLCTCYYEDADKGRVVLVCAPVPASEATTAAS